MHIFSAEKNIKIAVPVADCKIIQFPYRQFGVVFPGSGKWFVAHRDSGVLLAVSKDKEEAIGKSLATMRKMGTEELRRFVARNRDKRKTAKITTLTQFAEMVSANE